MIHLCTSISESLKPRKPNFEGAQTIKIGYGSASHVERMENEWKEWKVAIAEWEDHSLRM